MVRAVARLPRALLLAGVLAVVAGGAVRAADPTAPPSQAGGSGGGATLTAQPSVITATVAPGSPGRSSLTVRAGRALAIRVEPVGLGQAADDGSFGFLEADADTSRWSARTMIAVSPTTFQLPAGGTRRVDVSIALPAGSPPGDRYALLKVVGTPVDDANNVSLGVALGVSVIVEMAGASTQRAGELESLVATPGGGSDPVVVRGTIANTGNIHYGAAPNLVVQSAVLRDAAGTTLASARGELTGNSIVPDHARAFALALTPPQPLAAGTYTVDVEVGLSDGTILDRGSATLTADGGGAGGPRPTPPSTEGFFPRLVGPSAVLPFAAAGTLLVAGLAALVAFAARRGRSGRRAR